MSSQCHAIKMTCSCPPRSFNNPDPYREIQGDKKTGNVNGINLVCLVLNSQLNS